MPRPFIAIAAVLLLTGCALPPNTALRDWARLASVLADHPDAVAPAASSARDGLVAQQEALAIYLYALSVLAREESLLTFRDDAYAPLIPRAAAADPAAGAAVAALGQALATARAGNFPPGARARSAGSATVLEDLRLRPLIGAADAPVQVLVGTLSRGTAGLAGPEQETYRQVLTAIGEGHALLKARIDVIRQREVSRAILDQEDRLRRLTLILQPDAAVGLRPDPAGLVGAVVQP
ncbi:hypothetical protein KPL78_04525 [Roseomonas sp. HJA6]|uniref:Lipoprotein n=1 Tax=Roseomonas alba TaxID=2846776 RepID=A0ABS7A7D9_9PROT|nr:hypothetical protein [Neoroseomonas alba]MBW6397099.1 hypothetical protein [Neoroseomonas alba]